MITSNVDIEQAVLELKLVGDIAGRFFVPGYQRGYRWGPHEVTALLDDVWGSKGGPYSLQPIVVKRRVAHAARSEDELQDEAVLELIDGQQRLTTLYMIFHYMRVQGLQNAPPPWTIAYETRPGSASFLERLGHEYEADAVDAAKNIDFFHIHRAYHCIKTWFDGHTTRRQFVANEFYGYLFKCVRVIWYEAPHHEDSVTLFTRLNVGRIPLTDAELFKALLLSRSAARSAERAAQWDAMERDLRDPELWAFITTDRAEDHPTRLTLLLDALADRIDPPESCLRRRPYRTFDTLRLAVENADTEDEIWNQVVDLHALVVGWFDDRDLYHRIGFLVAVGVPIGRLMETASGRTRSGFTSALDDLIRRTIGVTREELVELSYLVKAEKCARILLLMNVETVRNNRNSSELFSFRALREGRWSLEHIHAQNAADLTKAEQWHEWLHLHRKALVELPTEDAAAAAELIRDIEVALSRQLTRHEFVLLAASVSAFFASDTQSATDPHTIDNLALLSSGANSALGNAVFEVKRSTILMRDRQGEFIPVCTRNVFLKYYTNTDARQFHLWSPQDRLQYLDAIIKKVGPFLTAEGAS